MDFAGIVDIALPVIYVLVGAVLVWFVVELALTIRSTRSTIDDAHKELTPTLKNVEKITAQVDPLIAHVDALVTDQIDPLLTRVNEIAEEAKPAVGRVDPLVERLSLTVDAANLELMRVDQILEDVTQITDSVSKAAGAVDTVTSAPIDLVNSLTGKLRSKFKPRYASDESVSLGAAADASAAAKAGRAPERGATVADAVSAMGDAARAVVAEGKDRRGHRCRQRHLAHQAGPRPHALFRPVGRGGGHPASGSDRLPAEHPVGARGHSHLDRHHRLLPARHCERAGEAPRQPRFGYHDRLHHHGARARPYRLPSVLANVRLERSVQRLGQQPAPLC